MLPQLLAVLAGVIGLFVWFVNSLLKRLNEENTFKSAPQTFDNPLSLSPVPVPSLFDKPSKELSIVVPAYNEELRLSLMLDETFSYLKRREKTAGSKFTYEIVVVDDGSTDNTVGIVGGYTRKHGIDTIRTLRLPQNCGKGFAVRSGALVSRGEKVVILDADGATRVSDIAALEQAAAKLVREGKENRAPNAGTSHDQAFVVGSRAYLEEASKAKRTWLRTFLMHGFHFLVALVVGRGIRDTQCGCKLVTRETARRLFLNQRLQRWCFDVELVRLAQLQQVPMAEVQVTWTEIPGSKLRVFSVLSMALELLLIKVGYGCSIWPLRGPLDLQAS